MQARNAEGKRPRISVSLDPEDYDWIAELTGESESLSYKLSRIVRAARLSGLTLEEAKSGGVLQEFSDFLVSKKRNKMAADFNELLTEFLKRK
jgi:hypothetical protein